MKICPPCHHNCNEGRTCNAERALYQPLRDAADDLNAESAQLRFGDLLLVISVTLLIVCAAGAVIFSY